MVRSILSVIILFSVSVACFGQIPPEVLEKLPPEIREELKNLPPDTQVTFTEGLPPDYVPPEPITVTYPPEYQRRIDAENVAAMYRGDKLYEALFFDEESKTQAIQSFIGITAEQKDLFEKASEYSIDEELMFDDSSPEIPEGCVPVDEAEGVFLAPIEVFLKLNREFDQHAKKVMEEILVPEQIQMARECFLALPSQIEVQMDGMEPIEILNFDAYAALDLTKEQRDLLKTIREESEQEFLSLLKELTETVQAESPSRIDHIRARLEKLRQYSSRTKARILSIMKPEQLAKLERIMKELPDKLAALQADLKKNAPDDSWKDSWKPGDPVPEGQSTPKQRKAFPLKIM